ncbi:MAG: HAD family hydrolase [Pyrinomonadaceae bacterium]|nr:HAD family hydrolase [Pyrinomonadaceae bacterium]
MIETIAFDADDTLWHNERIFLSAKEKYTDILSAYHDESWIVDHLDAAEMRNIKHFGYGIKGFTLSMVETAVDLTEGRVTGGEIREVIDLARKMLASPIEVLDEVEETIRELSESHRLLVITKGDLFDQETKLARSGLGDYFDDVEVVSQKNSEVYRKILARHEIDPNRFVMVGNSLKSDILPVVELGSNAVHIPYETEWFHERVSAEELVGKDYIQIEKISGLLSWLNERK